MRPLADAPAARPSTSIPARAPLRRGVAALRRASAGRGRAWIVQGALVAAGGALAMLLLDPPNAVFAMLWSIGVVAIVRSDLDRFLIPDEASAGIAGLGMLHAAALAWKQDGAGMAGALFDALASGAVAFGVFWLLALAYRRAAGRDGLGFGDVKLAGACGIWLSFAEQAAALEIACLGAIGLVLATVRGGDLRRTAVPFGAFLAPAAWLVFVAGPAVAPILERLA